VQPFINSRIPLSQSINKSINQSKHISIAPYVASESEAHCSWISSQVTIYRRRSNSSTCHTSVLGKGALKSPDLTTRHHTARVDIARLVSVV